MQQMYRYMVFSEELVKKEEEKLVRDSSGLK